MGASLKSRNSEDFSESFVSTGLNFVCLRLEKRNRE